jgi:hypothetical protein
MAEHILATCPTAEASWYEGVGHTAHLEEPERFNRELATLTRRVSSQGSAQKVELVYRTSLRTREEPAGGGRRSLPSSTRSAISTSQHRLAYRASSRPM